jgi:hypothetical protein
MFKGISPCIPAVSLLYFGPFIPFHCSPLPLSSHSPFFHSFQYMSWCPLPAQILCFTILLMLYHSLFLSSFPESHRLALLLQTFSTYEFVCYFLSMSSKELS